MKRNWMSLDYQSDLVSVIIATYNRANFIGDTLQIVFDQTYRPIEVIVVYDGSTDNTHEIVNKYKPKQDRDLTLIYMAGESRLAKSAESWLWRLPWGIYSIP